MLRFWRTFESGERQQGGSWRHPHITGDRGPSVPTSRTVRALGGATVWPWALGLPLAPFLAAQASVLVVGGFVLVAQGSILLRLGFALAVLGSIVVFCGFILVALGFFFCSLGCFMGDM